MHLRPVDRSGQRVIDGERVCQAIAAISPVTDIQARAKTFAMLGDPTHLSLLTRIASAEPISVSDLPEAVAAESHGRVIRFPFAEGPVAALLTR